MLDAGFQNRARIGATANRINYDLFANAGCTTVWRNNAANDIHSLQSEYLDVTLQLSSVGEMPDQDVYVFGGLTDWQIKPEFKMTFNPATNAYVAKLNLKQGYYEYLYAALPHGKSELDFEETEGNWHETNNYYTILVYYRPFGGRFDQIIGATSFSSRDQ